MARDKLVQVRANDDELHDVDMVAQALRRTRADAIRYVMSEKARELAASQKGQFAHA